MKRSTLCLALTSIALLSTACGGNGFGGSSGKKVADQRAAGSDGDDGASPSADATKKPEGGGEGAAKGDKLSLDPPSDATPEQEAIGKCLAGWGSHPFKADVYDSFREIHAAVSVFGGGGYAVEDTEVTDGPKLIVVHAAVSVLGQSNMLLMNPNGWYCIMTAVNVHTDSEIDLQCKAHLADSKVSVNVGSTASNASAVGVNVFSNVKVIRMKDAEKTGC